MKKILILLSAAVLLLGMTACSKKEEVQPEPEAATTAAVPEALFGDYHEQIAGRGHFTLDENGIVCMWSSSASETTEYRLPVEYDEENKRLVYQNGIRTDIVFESENKSTSTVVYEDGTGYFDIDGDKLIWHNDKEEGDPSTFVRDDAVSADMPNPWTYTMDIDEAIAASGVEFDPPVAVPEGFELQTYGGSEGVIEAVYTSNDRKMVVRKSTTVEGQELSGNYNTYSKNWNLTLKGVSIDCYGDGDTVNEAHFSGGDSHFTVSVFDQDGNGTEGNGITPDDVNSLINGMH